MFVRIASLATQLYSIGFIYVLNLYCLSKKIMQAKKKLFTVVSTVYNYSRILWLARGIEHNIAKKTGEFQKFLKNGRF